MGESALRGIAVAGLLAAGLLVGGPAVAPAAAEPADSDSSSQGSDSGGQDSDGSDGSGSSDDSDGAVRARATASNTPSGSSAPSSSSDEDDAADLDGFGDSDDGADLDDSSLVRIIGGGGEDPTEDLDEKSEDPDAKDAVIEPVDPGAGTGGADGGSRGIHFDLTTLWDPPKSGRSSSLTIPVPRLPVPEEAPPGSWLSLSSFYTTVEIVEIPVITFEDFLAALVIDEPDPEPPGPAFRTQEEAPVIDAVPGAPVAAGGSGSGGGGGGMVAESPVLRVPLVTVPRIATLGGQGSRAVETTATPPGGNQPGSAGARTPIIRGSLAPSPGASPQSVTAPLTGPRPARFGYPRGVANPTLAELAAVALPGVAGLILLTFGGGVIGYRQASGARFVRTTGAERFLA